MPDSEDPFLYNDIPGLPDGGQAYWLNTTDGLRLRFAIWRGGARGTILLYTGRTEYIEKYADSIDRFLSLGFSVMVSDWRGQGLSTRPENDLTYGWIENYQQYQDDIKALLAHDAVATLPGPRVLVAHSMGGAIGLRSLYNGLDVACAIFSAPMWGIKAPAMLRPVIYWVLKFAAAIGFGRKRLPFVTSGKPYVLNAKFEGNSLTTFEPTWDWLADTLNAHGKLALGGPSIRWLIESLDETRAMAEKAAVEVPTLTFIGSDESIVSPASIDAYHAKDGAGELVCCTGARHEMFMEAPDIQDIVWRRAEAFLDKHVPAKAP